MTVPVAQVSHQIAGRLRVRIPSLKGDAKYLHSIKNEFSGLKGITGVEINPMTGSVLFHLGDISLKTITDHALSRGFFRLDEPVASSVGLQQRITVAFNGFNDKMKSFTGGELDVASIAFIALAGAGIYQIRKGNFAAPAWYTAFWYALNIFLKSSKSGELS